MFLSSIGKPILSRNFGGKIMMEHVTNCKFTGNGLMNAHLHAGDWHQTLIDGDMTLSELQLPIV